MIKLELTEQEAQTIVDGLAELPFRKSAQLINKIMVVANKPEKASENGKDKERSPEQ